MTRLLSLFPWPLRTTSRAALGLLLILITGSFGTEVEKKPLPQELRTETLLILLYDQIPEGIGKDKRREESNAQIAKINHQNIEEAKKYPYPSATVLRSQYDKGENVPVHRFVLNGDIMKMYANLESFPMDYTADVYVDDKVAGTRYIIDDYKDLSAQLHLKRSLMLIVKRVEDGKKVRSYSI